jgi:23S rRNA (cytosine1962-C5)-methyltransferase
MPLINAAQHAPITLRLARDLTRTIKRGHPWIFAEALRQRPPARPGVPALLLDYKKGREVARGFYHPQSPLAFRVCTPEPSEPLDETWAENRLVRAVALRQAVIDPQTTGFRLFNGEGDGLPGLVCDLYGDVAVLQLDGPGPAGFWNIQGVAEWLAQRQRLSCVYLRGQSRADGEGRVLTGLRPGGPVPFLENGIHFKVDIVQGQKTGFFLDQRENRQLVRRIAAGRRVLNLFGYTGGFSVYAGLGGASHVSTVDVAGPALEAAQENWQLNQLPPAAHETVKADAFEYLAQAARQKQRWDLVIVDPPSFAHSRESVEKAVGAYQSLIGGAAAVTKPDGLLAAASCSSHVDLAMFLAACEEGISQARRRATVLSITGQPADHPTPLPLPEFRYLKFVLMRVE